MNLLSLLALLGFAAAVVAVRDSPSACSAFKPTNITNVALTNLPTYFSANASVNISNEYSSIDVSNLPAFCRVELTITTNTTAGSFALTEVWLPDDWNGRVLTLGNGGLAGGVTVAELGYVAVPQGFAGISTNTGHDGDVDDGSWAGPHNDNAIVDWGWRAMHLSVVAGKEVVQQYYSTPANKSYYLGCSNASPSLKEVQEFPEDFDGVIVGSPANWQTHLRGWSIHMNLNTQPSTSPHFMTEDIWDNVLAPEVLRQCDSLDGLVDGIISDPRDCAFRPETLTCSPGQNKSTCLTPDQISALHRIYAPYYEANQTFVFGGYFPGGETKFYHGLVGKKQSKPTKAYFQFMVTNNTDWTIHDYNATLLQLTDELDVGQSNAINPNIIGFVGSQHNGKLIQYVGWADQLISPNNSIYYYETVHEWTRANTNLDIDDFYRLFTVPGMNHCHGGFAANAFGGVQQASNNNPPLSLDPQHNILAAIVKWVEDGIAPDNFTAVNYNSNDVANGVGFTRPLCRYPSNLRYKSGDPNSASSFECVFDS
ncbi:feruloyl esterase-like protein [Dichomitus squalens]|uniref:Carboxylic ester hydrolase n=1 Tax=Dichomitus squalens TaxID=114155 RepID=A0A4Q9P7C1_9APHY|nr:feruloyl esterase-like protein [Dichomitus squalens]TBU62942.1 feruloyl esterase-like protein [Dichomitus squalens]